MQRQGAALRLSASDLVGHVDCHHLTVLARAAACGELERPYFRDTLLETLLERGLAHERQYLEYLTSNGRKLVEIAGPGVDASRAQQTLEAMRAGADVVVQGAFIKDQWGGRTDVLLRVDEPSLLGGWSYEVVDTKLARRTKGATILQLCVYSELVASVQGKVAERMHVVTPGTGFALESHRTASYGAYFRRVRGGFEGFLQNAATTATYPEPNPHCDLCLWRRRCDQRRREDDHLCFIAGITAVQIAELRRRNIATCAAFALTPIPLPWKPDRGSAPSYERAREQARIQIAGRAAGRVLYEVLPLERDLGFGRLPAPSPGDVFLDLEGDPFLDGGGIEYLFGYAFLDGQVEYRGEWALTREQEKRAFEQFVDFVMKRWEAHPDLHIYHYAPYEPAALKRLMGRYASREDEIDRMLRAELFVDLYQIARHGIRASIERYSIKELEPLYGFERGTSLDEAGRALATAEALLETGNAEAIADELKAVVSGYNRDDCLSARALRDWLESIRADLIGKGHSIPRPSVAEAEPSEKRSAWQARIDALIAQLTRNVPLEAKDRSVEQHARWILAYILDWHRREEKVVWWEKFRLCSLTDEDLLGEKAGLAGLTFLGSVGGSSKAPIHRYRFPPQETELRGEEQLHQRGGEKLGEVAAISLENRTVDIKKRKDTADVHPTAVFAHNVIATEVLALALARIGDFVARLGAEGEGNFRAARDLLRRARPRLDGTAMRLEGESIVESGMRVALKLRSGVLPIQGPPGTGKTHVGARMICALVKARKKVGITATGHKVIRNLLDEVIRAAPEVGVKVNCIQKVSEPTENQPPLHFTEDNAELFRALKSGCDVAAGTAWLWARPEAFECVDVLFVDEAAQMSLANVLAVSHAAPAVVLLGDPRQLDQPTQGSHPEGTSVSALDYVLDGRQTIGPDQGLFLRETWRLHPKICAFTSELFYEDRLTSLAGLERQEIRSSARIKGAGLRYLTVAHQGNQSCSPEEAQVVRQLVSEILESGATWVDRNGAEKPIALDDILIIAPYNAQVFELQDRLPGARIGTVDKFQGQEAPIVIYSMTTSSHADAPRGMSFLYSLNRLNVATSRAKVLSVLVCSPALFEPECRTPAQMQMANAFCRYLEMAEPLGS